MRLRREELNDLCEDTLLSSAIYSHPYVHLLTPEPRLNDVPLHDLPLHDDHPSRTCIRIRNTPQMPPSQFQVQGNCL
jgi:hypothetical protein